jgi:hypothetical protein
MNKFNCGSLLKTSVSVLIELAAQVLSDCLPLLRGHAACCGVVPKVSVSEILQVVDVVREPDVKGGTVPRSASDDSI